MHPRPEARTLAFTGAGIILVAVGTVVTLGWPFVLGGLVLLAFAAGTR